LQAVRGFGETAQLDDSGKDAHGVKTIHCSGDPADYLEFTNSDSSFSRFILVLSRSTLDAFTTGS
jgi:hypothetical protein